MAAGGALVLVDEALEAVARGGDVERVADKADVGRGLPGVARLAGGGKLAEPREWHGQLRPAGGLERGADAQAVGRDEAVERRLAARPVAADRAGAQAQRAEEAEKRKGVSRFHSDFFIDNKLFAAGCDLPGRRGAGSVCGRRRSLGRTAGHSRARHAASGPALGRNSSRPPRLAGADCWRRLPPGG